MSEIINNIVSNMYDKEILYNENIINEYIENNKTLIINSYNLIKYMSDIFSNLYNDIDKSMYSTFLNINTLTTNFKDIVDVYVYNFDTENTDPNTINNIINSNIDKNIPESNKIFLKELLNTYIESLNVFITSIKNSNLYNNSDMSTDAINIFKSSVLNQAYNELFKNFKNNTCSYINTKYTDIQTLYKQYYNKIKTDVNNYAPNSVNIINNVNNEIKKIISVLLNININNCEKISDFNTYILIALTEINNKDKYFNDNITKDKYIQELNTILNRPIDGTEDVSDKASEIIYEQNSNEYTDNTDNSTGTSINNWMNNAANWFSNVGNKIGTGFSIAGQWIGNTSATIGKNIADYSVKAFNYASNVTKKVVEVFQHPESDESYDSVNKLLSSIENPLDNFASTIENLLDDAVDDASYKANTISQLLTDSLSNINTSSKTLTTFNKAISVAASALKTYVNGVDETLFGSSMENSWRTGSSSFIQTFLNNNSTYKVRFTDSTPLDPGTNVRNLWGSMLLGTPPMFTNIADPNLRAYSMSFLKDAKFLTLTPGLPKYSGGVYDTYMGTSNLLNQTKTGTTQLEYLLRNGIDSDIANKDKRYYTFSASYDEYFAYLETMLNTVRIKFGLASEGDNSYSILTFINPKTNKLYSKYNNSLGFFINPSGISTEMFNSTPSSFGQEQASQINSEADNFNRTNYLTGMGTGSGYHNASRIASNTVTTTASMMNSAADFFKLAQQFSSKSKNIITRTAKFAIGAALDAMRYPASNDASALIQKCAAQNGLNVIYPELWSQSSFDRSITINFEFISPYGTPEAIFQHVMVPFCALLCFAMPRQADYNGHVSPFFVRSDVSGVFSCDFGIISNLSFTRGGNNDMWSKDGLPLAISGSFTITDLYPFNAMTKRLSYLSANPNYASFLNSFAGLHIVDNDKNNALNTYFRQLLNRVSGLDNMPVTKKLWNIFSTTKRESNKKLNELKRANKINMINSKSLVFMRK